MANNYYQMTGVLRLKAITPVILALFGIFNVKNHDEGMAYIKQDDNSISNESLADQVADVMELDPVDALNDYLIAMAEKLGKKDAVEKFLAGYELIPDDDAELDFLFLLAQLMDDGHGLESLIVDGAWTCDKMRLGEFGGSGEFCGKTFTMGSGSFNADVLGPQVDGFLGNGNVSQAAGIIGRHFDGLLNGIRDETMRAQVKAFIINEWKRG